MIWNDISEKHFCVRISTFADHEIDRSLRNGVMIKLQMVDECDLLK